MPATLVSALRGVLPLLIVLAAAAPAHAAGAELAPEASLVMELEHLADGSVLETTWAEQEDAATAAAFAYPTRCKRVSVTRRKTNGVWTLW